MGMFDGLFAGDPNQQSQLAVAAGLLGSRGNFANALGGSLMGGQKAYSQAVEAAQQRQLQQLQMRTAQAQLNGLEQKQADEDAVRQFWSNPQNYSRASMQAPGDYGPGEAPQMPGGPLSPRGVAQNMLASGSPMLAQQGFQGLQKTMTPQTVKAGETLGAYDPETGKFNAAYTAPKESAPSQLSELITERNKYPVGSPLYKIYDDAIQKASTHQPPIVQMGLGSPVAVTGPDGRQLLVQPPTKPGGKAEIVQIPGMGPARPATENKPLTESQANANMYALRMERSDKILSELEGKYPRSAVSARQAVGEGVAGSVANSLMGSTSQQADQAQRDFINAVLRRESGAAISSGEFKNYRQQYFPQPGDSVEVVAQKAANRRTAIQGLKEGAGPSAPINKEKPSVIDFGSLDK